MRIRYHGRSRYGCRKERDIRLPQDHSRDRDYQAARARVEARCPAARSVGCPDHCPYLRGVNRCAWD